MRGCAFSAQRQISIHAPPRGATPQRNRGGRNEDISIHAPPRGATHTLPVSSSRRIFQFTPLREGRRGWRNRRCPRPDNFNSRPSARGDAQWLPRENDCEISIHAPPRGATRHFWMATRFVYFNSRPSARGDGASPSGAGTAKYFNSRPSARGDEGSHDLQEAGHYFNSRPSARGDPAVSRVVSLPFVFQFTPLREGRRATCYYCGREALFQFTPLREGRRNHARQQIRIVFHFNSRPSARGDEAEDER